MVPWQRDQEDEGPTHDLEDVEPEEEEEEDEDFVPATPEGLAQLVPFWEGMRGQPVEEQKTVLELFFKWMEENQVARDHPDYAVIYNRGDKTMREVVESFWTPVNENSSES